MLRALCLGILAISAAPACKGKSDTSTVAANAPAGKVVSVSGPVEAKRAGATRPLAVGTEVFADDEVKTGADATVEIELFHNNAKWSLTANKQGRVDASLAWGMGKQEASKTVEHNTAAAGREAERSAAETSATAAPEEREERKKEKAMEPPKPSAAPMTESMPAAPGAAAPSTDEAAGGGAVPPPPPDRGVAEENNAAPEKIEAPKPAPRDLEQRKGAPRNTGAQVVISPQTLADKHKPDFAKCFDAGTKATITIDVRMNKSTTSIAGVKTVTAKQKQCVADAAKAIEWPVKGATFQVKVKLE